MLQNRCPCCASPLRITRLTCDDCALGLEGDFVSSRLSRLNPDEQQFVEVFLLASGSLKRTAERLGVSYPTVRNRLDKLIVNLGAEQAHDEKRKRQILEDIEAGRIPPKQAQRMIESL